MERQFVAKLTMSLQLDVSQPTTGLPQARVFPKKKGLFCTTITHFETSWEDRVHLGKSGLRAGIRSCQDAYVPVIRGAGSLPFKLTQKTLSRIGTN